MNFLEVSAVNKQQNGTVVVNNVSLIQQQYQKLAIAGETGSGKSTLLKMIAGWIQPDAGQLFFQQQRIIGPEEQLLPGHSSIAYLSQHFELRNNYRVEEILDMAQKLNNDEAQTIYEVCRISHLLKRRTDQLSGGEKQRIAAARLLIATPKLLLLDEPYSNLDIIHRNILKQVIHDISEQLKITCILISHDPADVLSWADEIIVIKDGSIVQQGSPETIYRKPVDEYTAGLFGKYFQLSPALSAQFGITISSELNNPLFVRPEAFVLTEATNALKGQVKNIFFFGGFYEVEVLLLDTLVTIRTSLQNIAKDEWIDVSLNTDHAWYM